MVHVRDIVQATLRTLARGVAGGDGASGGERLNVGGHTFLLGDLLAHCKYPPAATDLPATDLSSKRVSSDKLLREVMPPGYRFAQPLPEACLCGESDPAASVG
jgi:nucleoside-diphosphate-sugar epimerase